jgi:hypothetical protein
MLCLLCSGKRFDAFDACCGLIARCSLIGLGERLSDREVIASELFSRLWIYLFRRFPVECLLESSKRLLARDDAKGTSSHNRLKLA